MQSVKDREIRMSMEFYEKRDTLILVYMNDLKQGTEGEFRHLYSEDFFDFRSISEFIFKLELMLEQIDCPKTSDQCRRTWKGKEEEREELDREVVLKEEPCVNGSRRGKDSFLIQIWYRQNASWQGQIRWMGKEDYTMKFRSVLELIMILEHSIHITEMN